MRTIPASGLLAIAILALTSGCVDRRFVVESNVPGAQVSVNGNPIGPSPADTAYEYPGRYEFRAVAPGYEPLVTTEVIRPRWFDYPGLDFFAEVVWPGRIEDSRRIQLTLVPAQKVNTQELLSQAGELRNRGSNLPAPQYAPQTAGAKLPPSSTNWPAVVPPDGTPQTTPAIIPTPVPTTQPPPPGAIRTNAG